MKREDILEKHGKILRKDVQKSLNMLGNSLFENLIVLNKRTNCLKIGHL